MHRLLVEAASQIVSLRKLIKVSITLGSAKVETSPNESSSLDAILRKIRLMILPLRVFGKAGAN